MRCNVNDIFLSTKLTHPNNLLGTAPLALGGHPRGVIGG
jgi:hypothetical protein